MDSQNYFRMISYIVCELSMPVKKHVYKSLINDQSSMNHHLLTAAAKAARKKYKLMKTQKLSSNHIGLRLYDNSSVNNSGQHMLKDIKLNECRQVEPLLEDQRMLQDENGSEMQFTNLSPTVETEDEYTDEVILDDSDNNENMLTEDTSFQSMCRYSDEDNTNCQTSKIEELESVEDDKVNSNQDDAEVNEVAYDYSRDSEFLHDSSDSESCDVSSFYSDPILLCSEADFKTMFRMTRTSFQNVVLFLSKEEMEPIENVALYKKVLIVLWLMGNSGSYSDAAQVFSITEEAAANCFFDVCATLYNKSDSVIGWPTSKECDAIASRIEKRYGFPGVVGILGCHYFSISIPKEALSRREHFNAKHRTYSVALQIVCDDRLIIRDIFPGLPGSIPEAQVLRDSPLCEQLTSKTQLHPLVEPHKHVLARSEYPQLTSMLTPYTKTTTTLSKDEIELNRLHENVCQLVDHTFKMLQDRFLTLKLLDPEVATMVLVAACVLHNICLENDDVFEAEE